MPEATLVRTVRRSTAAVVVFLALLVDGVLGDPTGLNNWLVVGGYVGGLAYLAGSVGRQLYERVVEDPGW